MKTSEQVDRSVKIRAVIGQKRPLRSFFSYVALFN